MWLNVTERDIRNGKRGDVHKCVIAKCIARYLNLDPMDVFVGGANIWIKHRYFTTTKKLQSFIQDFDDGLVVKPFSFSLPIKPPKVQARLVVARKEKKVLQYA